MNKVLLVIIGSIILLFIIYFSTKSGFNPNVSKPPSESKTLNQITTFPTLPEQIDYKAGFAIFTNGTFRVFTAVMYHNLSEDVYIQADNPNTIHLKKRGITWDYFFKTLPFKLTKDCLTTGTGETFCTTGSDSLKFYLNGVKTDDLLGREIRDSDKALITYGSESKEDIQKQNERLN
ncbi:hypothetical protein HY612_00200 [Candidatus Roizmanbacteria bacterium]|nr:hypothetical protein [Candidatus Roizmanbacteria bacterium]